MNFSRRVWLGRFVLLTFALLSAAWLARLDYTRKISTDVTDLIPSGERAPELALVRALASQAEARAMFFVLTNANGTPAPAAAAERFANALRTSSAFEQASAMNDPALRDALGRELFAQRFTLLFPIWLRERTAAFAPAHEEPAHFEEWLARDAVDRLGRFLNEPAAIGFQDEVPSDPLLLLPGAVDRLKGGLALLQPAPSGPSATLVWARLAQSPLSEAGQRPAFAAIAAAATSLQTDFSGIQVSDTGINRFAAMSRRRIEREMSWLNTLSLLAVLGVAVTFVRVPYRALHLIPVVLVAVLGAWVAVTAAFDRLHVIVFVIGSLLAGVAVDYGFYLYMQPPVTPDEDYGSKVRRLLKPLLASCFTTVTGFALLLASELPLIRQLGVFVGAGLLCALAGAIIYFGTLKNSFLPARAFRGAGMWPPTLRRRLRRALLVVWVVALAGLVRIRWKDDVRDLEIPAPELQAQDASIRAAFGQRPDQTVYLTRGATLTDARSALERFDRWLQVENHGRAQFVNLGLLIPTSGEHGEAVQFARSHPQFPAVLRAALDAGGFESNGFEPFFTAYADYVSRTSVADWERAVAELPSKLNGPQSLLLHVGPGLSWFITITASGTIETPPADTATVSASQLQSLNNVFARYRMSALRLSLIGLAIVGLGVFATYGLRDGVRIFAIPCGSCLGLFGLFGWCGLPLNLFHLLGAFLGVCLTHNYSIFSATSAYRREPPPISVRLSALTTAASFGVLAFSGIPVVRALGITVSAMVIAALTIIELEHLQSLAPSSHDDSAA
jgi:predicted exporter